MSNERVADDPAATAETLVAASLEHDSHVSIVDRNTLVEALTEDLRAASDRATVDEERLVKIETQTRVLAEAVIAITDTAEAVRPAVQAVKDEM